MSVEDDSDKSILALLIDVARWSACPADTGSRFGVALTNRMRYPKPGDVVIDDRNELAVLISVENDAADFRQYRVRSMTTGEERDTRGPITAVPTERIRREVDNSLRI